MERSWSILRREMPGRRAVLSSFIRVLRPESIRRSTGEHMIRVAMMHRLSLALLIVVACAGISEGQILRPAHGDFVIKNFRFASGEVLPSVRLHYRTLGKPRRDASG